MPFCPEKRVLIITDDIVNSLYGDKLYGFLTDKEFEVYKFVFKNGEASKNINTISDILEYAAKSGLRRNDMFLALGGGVTGDIAGLSAALYMRGVKIIQIPTTLLAAVDSSVGGKTGIDLNGGKNLVGAFKQPSLVICDTEIIKNLPDNIFNEGMGEVIKCCLIGLPEMKKALRKDIIKGNIKDIIYQCINLKREIVEKDEFDTLGIRNRLNAGHTIGHAIESLSDYQISHGRAVATGLYIESLIALRLGICDIEIPEKLKNIISHFGLFLDLPFSKEDIADICLKDKKNTNSRILFLLPEDFGKIKEVYLTKNELTGLL